MSMILFSLVISAALLLLIAGILYGGGRASAVAGVALISGLTFFCLPAVAVQMLLTLVFSLIGAVSGARARTVFIGAAAAMAGVYLVAGGLVLEKWQELQALRRDYPVVSLEDRLAYERHFVPLAAEADAAVPLSTRVAMRLDEFESGRAANNHYYSRAAHLQTLHERTADAFAQVVGFGPVRMRQLQPETIRMPATPPIPLPKPSERYSPDAAPEWHAGPMAVHETESSSLGQKGLLARLHDASVDDLLDPDRIGWVKGRQQAAGFQSHAFTRLPVPVQSSDAEWRVVRLDLIGMWSQEQPVAYATDELPKMDELGDAPTRPLDAFEQSAVERLQTDEDVVTDARPEVIRMLGSLRAARDCLDCHSVQRGRLLGALSYELRPLGAPRPTIEPPADPQARLPESRQVAQSR